MSIVFNVLVFLGGYLVGMLASDTTRPIYKVEIQQDAAKKEQPIEYVPPEKCLNTPID